MIQEITIEVPTGPKYTNKSQMAADISKAFSQIMKYTAEHGEIADRYSPAIFERRKRAILSTIPKIEKRFKDRYPNIDIADEMIRFLTLASDPVEKIFYRRRMDTAAALWMLNQIYTNDNIQQLKAVLPKDPVKLYDIPTVHISDGAFTEELIRSMTYVVLNRNEEYGIARQVNLNQNLKRFPSPVHDHMTCREIFNYALSLIDPYHLECAVDCCKDTILDLISTYLDGCTVYKKQLDAQWSIIEKHATNDIVSYTQQFDPTVREAMVKYDDLMKNADKYRFSFMDRSVVDTLLKKAEKCIFSVDVDDPFETAFAVLYLLECDDDFVWMYNFTKPLLIAAEQQLPWNIGYEHTVDVDGRDFEDIEKESQYFPECDIDWDMPDDEESPDMDETDLVSEDVTDAGTEGLDPNTDCYDAEDCLEESDYKDVRLLAWATRKEIMICGMRTTLSRLLYSLTHTVLPTNATLTLLDDIDLPEDEKMFLLALFSMSSQSSCSMSLMSQKGVTRKVGDEPAHTESAATQGPDDVLPEENGWPDAVYVDLKEMEELRTKNKALKAELDKLKTALYHTEKELRKTQERNAQEAEETEKMRRELTDLRNLQYLQKKRSESQDRPEPVVQDTDSSDDVIYVSFPFKTDRKIVVFGGHDSWLREIRPLLPTVRFVARESSTYDVDIIRNADVLWFQHNALAHSQFGKAKDIARQYGVDIRYFPCDSARKCAEELVEDILLRD